MHWLGDNKQVPYQMSSPNNIPFDIGTIGLQQHKCCGNLYRMKLNLNTNPMIPTWQLWEKNRENSSISADG